MKISSMTKPMLAAFGECFTHKGTPHQGIIERVEIENDAGYRIALVVHVEKSVSEQFKAGDLLLFQSGNTHRIKRIGEAIDDLVEVEIGTSS